MKTEYDIIIVGGGAAGFFAACELADEKLKIAIVEKSSKVLSKVKISGGGRCNVTHQVDYNSELVKNYPNGKSFLKKVFKKFNNHDTLNWFKKRGVDIKAEEDGRMFPVSDDSQTIIDALIKGSINRGVEIVHGFDLLEIEKGSDFMLHSRKGDKLHAKKVLLATGGYPKDDQFNWIKLLGHTVNPPVPSLFTFNIPFDGLAHLSGLSVPNAKVSIVGEKLNYEGPLLITHWGVSGPAVLKISAWGARLLHQKGYEFKIHINWMNSKNEDEIIQKLQAYKELHPKKKVHTNPAVDLPKRLWEELMIRADISGFNQYGDIGSKSINRMVECIFRLELNTKGKTTFKEEFVTSGGVNLSEVNSHSMESTIVPGIYFAGEVLDIDGITGGFNFQAAWSTAYTAAANMKLALKY